MRPRKAQQVPLSWMLSGTLLQRSAGVQGRRHAIWILSRRLLGVSERKGGEVQYLGFAASRHRPRSRMGFRFEQWVSNDTERMGCPPYGHLSKPQWTQPFWRIGATCTLARL